MQVQRRLMGEALQYARKDIHQFHARMVGHEMATADLAKRLGGDGLSMTEERVQRRLAAILAADVLGYRRDDAGQKVER